MADDLEPPQKVFPVTFNDEHLISVRIEAEIGSTVTLQKRINYGKTQVVRGGDGIVMVEDTTFVADYEVPQNLPVEYRSIEVKGGVTLETAWVLAENLDTGGDWFLALDQPWNGMSLMVESSSRASTTSPQSVVNVWGRSDPIVVSGVRHMPELELVAITETVSERDQLMDNLSTGQVCMFSQWHAEVGWQEPTFVSVGKVDIDRVSRYAEQQDRRISMDLTEVLAPPAFWRYPAQEARTWGTVKDDFANWRGVQQYTWREIVSV